MSMGSKEKEEKSEEKTKEAEEEKSKKDDGHVEKKEVLEEALRMIIMAAMIQGSQAQRQGEDEKDFFWVFFVMVAFLAGSAFEK